MSTDAEALAVDTRSVTGTASPIQPRTSHAYLVTSLAFVSCAALDVLEPTVLVSGAWWLVLLLVWLMPWPNRAFDSPVPARLNWRTIHPLLALTVFSWLYFRATTSLLEAALYWEIVDTAGSARGLNYVVQALVVGLITGTLLAPPLQRTFGRDASAAAFVVATPWIILTCTDTVFDLSRWFDRPLSNALWLFEATVPPLLLMEACALLERRGTGTMPRSPGGTPLRSHLSAALARCPRWLASSTAQPLLVLTLFAFGLRFYVDDIASLSPAAASACLAATPLCGLLLTAATVHELRRRGTLPERSGHWARLRSHLETVAATVILAPLWLWILLVDAPLAEYYAMEAITNVPGPAWTVDYDQDSRTLSVSGEYQFGVSAAFSAALNSHPDAQRVELSGPGGRLDEGLAIAYAIESRELDTHVRAECASACTLAFIAGHRRSALKDALLGFHAVSTPIGVFDVADNEYDHYLTARGVDAEFIRRTAETPSDDMWYPTNDHLLQAGVLTAPDGLPDGLHVNATTSAQR